MHPIVLPVFDPVAVHLGPLMIRWYALAYVTEFMVGAWVVAKLNLRPPMVLTKDDIDALVVWMIAGVLLGGRIGYVLFYQLPFYSANPLEAFKIWHGGMSFHGGFLGVLAATAWFCRRHGKSFLQVTDLLAVITPIGLFLGRIANFINGELYGRVTDVPWAMVFPHGGPEPRHPSQLYEAGLEGIVLFILLFTLAVRFDARKHTGLISGVFLIGYACARIVSEQFRMPDEQLGFLIGGLTMGQLLSAPMVLLGIWLTVRARTQPAAA